VRWSEDAVEPGGVSQWDDPEFLAAYWAEEALGNFGFTRAERLPGNVGLLEIHSVDEPEGTGPTVDAAFGFLSRCSALVLDLRETNGGAPSGVAHLLGHLLPAGTPLVDVVDRSGAVTESTRVPDDATATVPDDVPVFCLIGPRTVSGCEELVYDLRAHGRAVLVGETTVGAANPVDPYVVDPHVVVRVPTGRVVHAVTGGNWEGAGVQPDHRCAVADALTVAHRLALTAIGERLPRSSVTRALAQEVQDALRELT
jgi:C-terminal processing protease CtpA/Prc